MTFPTDVRARIMRIATVAGLAALLSISLVACGGNETSSSAPTATTATSAPTATTASGGSTGASDTPTSGTSSSGAEEQVNATLNEWSVTLSPSDMSAGKVKYTVSNDGQFTHDFVILDSSGNKVGGTEKFNKAQNPQTLEVDLKSGTYTFLCDIPGHADRGMKTEITVK